MISIFFSIYLLAECVEYSRFAYAIDGQKLACNSPFLSFLGEIKPFYHAAFPHMAAIGWPRPNKIEFKCGGSLISERFVLTAAHCASPRDPITRLPQTPPTMVRLGDEDLYSKDDYFADNLNVSIDEIIVHDEYRTGARGKNDIALLKLAKSVEFTNYILPACLWDTKESIEDYQDFVQVAGWGVTETGNRSDWLMYGNLNIIPNDQCQSLWRNAGLSNFFITDDRMCAGLVSGGADTCKLDILKLY